MLLKKVNLLFLNTLGHRRVFLIFSRCQGHTYRGKALKTSRWPQWLFLHKLTSNLGLPVNTKMLVLGSIIAFPVLLIQALHFQQVIESLQRLKTCIAKAEQKLVSEATLPETSELQHSLEETRTKMETAKDELMWLYVAIEAIVKRQAYANTAPEEKMKLATNLVPVWDSTRHIRVGAETAEDNMKSFIAAAKKAVHKHNTQVIDFKVNLESLKRFVEDTTVYQQNNKDDLNRLHTREQACLHLRCPEGSPWEELINKARTCGREAQKQYQAAAEKFIEEKIKLVPLFESLREKKVSS